MTNYQQREVGCNCCGCDVPTAETTVHNQPAYMCRVCYETGLGRAFTHPTIVKDAELYKSLAQLGNLLLKEIRR